MLKTTCWLLLVTYIQVTAVIQTQYIRALQTPRQYIYICKSFPAVVPFDATTYTRALKTPDSNAFVTYCSTYKCVLKRGGSFRLQPVPFTRARRTDGMVCQVLLCLDRAWPVYLLGACTITLS